MVLVDMVNPSNVVAANNIALKHRVIAKEGGTPLIALTATEKISGGEIFEDAIMFGTDPGVGQATDIIYVFKYNKDIIAGDEIVLKLPGWSLVVPETACSDNSFSTEANCTAASSCTGTESSCVVQTDDTSCTSLATCGAGGTGSCGCAWSANIWTKPLTAETSSGCVGSTVTPKFNILNGDDSELQLDVSVATISANTACEITINGLSNPSVAMDANSDTVQHKIVRSDPADSSPFVKIMSSPALLLTGVMSQDSLSFNDNLPGATYVTINYVYEYSNSLKIGDKILIKLPGWMGANPEATVYTGCGSGCTYDAEITGKNASDSFGLQLTLQSSPQDALVICTLHITGIENPNALIPKNDPNIRHKIISESGGMPYRAVATTEEISGGSIYSDSIKYTLDSSIGQPSIISFAFKSKKDIAIGNQIKLNLPGYTEQVSQQKK